MIAKAFGETSGTFGRPIFSCIDPFGGSETTALACQFLGAAPTTIELNPYLADLGWLCRTNPMRDSSRESSVVAGLHEQTHIPRLQDQELASVQFWPAYNAKAIAFGLSAC